ncbi:uncharacterized protein LOC131941861 [Physella acuta]|uniref:uncharacterized protein LOC131941861 n=1 Tax=Physella acuta TaxID=109671 RepID=UPI0027DC6DC3|nr:uncharacterized protein LOC131941861 [Physella acuta]
MSNMMKVCLVVVLISIADGSPKEDKCSQVLSVCFFSGSQVAYFVRYLNELNKDKLPLVCGEMNHWKTCKNDIPEACGDSQPYYSTMSVNRLLFTEIICSNNGKIDFEKLLESGCVNDAAKYKRVKRARDNCGKGVDVTRTNLPRCRSKSSQQYTKQVDKVSSPNMSNMMKVCLVFALVFMADGIPKEDTCLQVLYYCFYGNSQVLHFIRQFSELNNDKLPLVCGETIRWKTCKTNITGECGDSKFDYLETSVKILSFIQTICSKKGKKDFEKLLESGCVTDQDKYVQVKQASLSCHNSTDVPSDKADECLKRKIPANCGDVGTNLLVKLMGDLHERWSKKKEKCHATVGCLSNEIQEYYINPFTELNSSYYARVCVTSRRTALRNCVKNYEEQCIDKYNQLWLVTKILSLSNRICGKDGKIAIEKLETSKCLASNKKQEKVRAAFSPCSNGSLMEIQQSRK